jgi:hypothetical protein
VTGRWQQHLKIENMPTVNTSHQPANRMKEIGNVGLVLEVDPPKETKER